VKQREMLGGFVVLKSNRRAFDTMRRWIARGAPADQLLCLVGPSATGKTHLAHLAADWLAGTGMRAEHLSVEQFLQSCRSARRLGRTAARQHWHWWATVPQMLVLEHLEYLAKDQGAFDELAMLLRVRRRAGRPTLLTVTAQRPSQVLRLLHQLTSSPLRATLVALQQPRPDELGVLAEELAVREEGQGLTDQPAPERDDWWRQCSSAAAIVGEIHRRALTARCS
jgi:chromosomal replication initiation ATPase DnaA